MAAGNKRKAFVISDKPQRCQFVIIDYRQSRTITSKEILLRVQ